MKSTEDKRRRDWSIIILILPLGVVMMMCVGQLAIRMAPDWSVSGDMKSSLDPESAPKQDALIIQPISNEILTPVTWWDTFLTPSGDSGGAIVFPPFITFEPSATVTATASATATPTTYIGTGTVTVTATPSVTVSPTKKPTDDNDTPTPPTTCTNPAANNNGGPLPCIFPVTSTPVGTQTAIPTDTTVGTPDGIVGGIPDGTYIVLNLTLSGTPIVVTNPSETNYDMVYYERPTGGGVDMDSVIVSISMDNVIYYVVFNWGDNQPNDHTNVDVNDLPPPPSGCTDLECDNQHIDASDLHDPDGGGSAPGTGILIDVDNAPSNPPPGNYWYIVIDAPEEPPGDVYDDGADVDAIEIVENTPVP